MKRFLVCMMLGFLSCFVIAEETTKEPASLSMAHPLAKEARDLRVQIEPLSEDQKKTGLTEKMLHEVIEKNLQMIGVRINDQREDPYLVLRVRTIPVGLDLASFVQLSFYEDAMLARNRSMFHAMTWSQASLISCMPEALPKELKEIIHMMITTFNKDYLEAMQPID